MTRRRISPHFEIDFGSANPVWRAIRNSAAVTDRLRSIGEGTVPQCNADLHAAQAKRKQPKEDGYDFDITHGSRARLHIFPTTARAMAHEAVNQTILKNITTGAAAKRGPDHTIPPDLARRANQAQGRGGGAP